MEVQIDKVTLIHIFFTIDIFNRFHKMLLFQIYTCQGLFS